MLRFSPRLPGWRGVRKLAAWLFLIALFYFLYIWHLGTLTSGISQTEAAARRSSENIHTVMQNPLWLPHKLTQLAFQSLGHHGAFWMRLSSVIFAAVFLACSYYLMRVWFGKMIGFFGVIILAATPMFMLAARNAAPTIMLMAAVGLISAYVWFIRTEERSDLAFVVLALSAGLAIYIPGMIWVIVAGAALGRERLIQGGAELSRFFSAAAAGLFLAALAPLVVASIHHLSVAKGILLIPGNLPSPGGFLHYIPAAVGAIFWKTKSHIDINIGLLPLLSFIQIVLSAFGAFALFKRARRESYFLVAVLAITIIGVAINQSMIFTLFCLPIFILLVAAGLRYLHYEWLSVFPKNPLPRTLALLLISVVVGLQLVYGARYVLEAWPKTTDTKSSFVLK